MHMVKGQWTSYTLNQLTQLPLSSYPLIKQSHQKPLHSLKNSAESVCIPGIDNQVQSCQTCVSWVEPA